MATVQEILDELRADLLRDTSDRIGGRSVDIWRPAYLVGCINVALAQFVSETKCLRVYRDKKYDLKFVNGVAKLRDDVLGIKYVYDGDTEVAVVDSYAKANAGMGVFVDAQSLVAVFASWYSGTMTTVTHIDHEPVSIDSLDAEVSVPRRHLPAVREYAAYTALMNHDSKPENIDKANAHFNMWLMLMSHASSDLSDVSVTVRRRI